MQQFSCNLEPPDQGYLIINKGEGREGGGSDDGTWILIHHNVRDKLPWWLHTINYTNCPTVDLDGGLEVFSLWSKNIETKQVGALRLPTIPFVPLNWRTVGRGSQASPGLSSSSTFCFCFESEIQLWKNVWDFRVKTKNDLFLQWLCV